MKIKRSTFYVFGVLALIVVAGLFLINSGSGTVTGNVVNTGGYGEVQEITLGMRGGNYYPNSVKVKVNQPVEITLDDSVYGCFRDFTMREFGIREYLQTPQDKVTFTPTKIGTFTFACSMNMGSGKLIVE